MSQKEVKNSEKIFREGFRKGVKNGGGTNLVNREITCLPIFKGGLDEGILKVKI